MNNDEFLTTKEVADLVRIAPNTLRNWRLRYPTFHEGPPSFRLGSRVLYRRTDVEAWIAEAMAAEGVA